MNFNHAAAAAAALLLGGCGMALVKPDETAGLVQLQKAATQLQKAGKPADAAKGAAETAKAVAEYRAYLKKQQAFDEPMAVYATQFQGRVKDVSAGTMTGYGVPSDGIQHYYSEHVAAFARGYLGLGRAYLAAGDLVRAERAANNAIDVVTRRIPWSATGVTETQEAAWALLEDIYVKAGSPRHAAWARMERERCKDYLGSPRAEEARGELGRLKEHGEKQLAKANEIIAGVNARMRQELSSSMAITLGAMADTVATYNEMRVRNQVRDQGYMTDSQASELQSLQSMRFMNRMIMQTFAPTASQGMRNAVAYNQNFNRVFYQQFTDPKAGADPTGIVKRFVDDAVKLKPGDGALGKDRVRLVAAADKLDTARRSGDKKQADSAFEQFAPALEQFRSTLLRAQ